MDKNRIGQEEVIHSLEFGASYLVYCLALPSLGCTSLPCCIETGVDLLREGRLVDVTRGNGV